ncbi:hypothetical protein LJR296_008099 [Cupriavidus necator]|uniref:hypothetical protein n=1 Tax=Cupriavidus necator TaxID=106590 RepID=UPI003ECF489A
MNKNAAATIATGLSILLSTNAHAEQSVIYVSPPHIAYEIQVLEKGRVIHATTVSAIPGSSSSSKTEQTISYLASCDRTAEALSCNPGTVWNGFEIELTPALAANGDVTTEVGIKDSQLISMDTVIQDDGFLVQAPRVSTATAKMRIALLDGKAIQLPYADVSTGVSREISITARKI